MTAASDHAAGPAPATGPRNLARERCRAVLGPPSHWKTPDGYPNGLALCVLDSIWSIGVKYRGVENVLREYRAIRTADGADPEQDTATQLVDVFTAAGGPDHFSDLVKNHQRTSTRGGVSKSQAVLAAANVLVRYQQADPIGVRSASIDQLAELERAWRGVHGQRSGISWRYFLLLSGRQEVKPDRMIIRFVQTAIDRRPSPGEAADLVAAAAASDGLRVDLRTLDHRIWQFQSSRG